MMSEQFIAVVGTCDTKWPELAYLRDRIVAQGKAAKVVDVTPHGSGHGDVSARAVLEALPGATERIAAASTRGEAVTAISDALVAWTAASEHLIAGMVGLGGSGNTALIAPAMRTLAIGVPKLMVSTVASGNVGSYVGQSDIAMMYSVVDFAGLNSISRKVLANAAGMMAGAVSVEPEVDRHEKPAIGLTMFGVTTPCVEQVVSALEDRFECFVFHATGTGGQAMEKLVESGALHGLIDITTTEVADLLMGGVMSAGQDRMGAAIRTSVPYVGSCGALDMVNFGAMKTVPPEYSNRQLLVHNEQVTLMRTTPEENSRIGEWIAGKLNQMNGQVRFLIPEKAVSAVDVPGGPFHDPEADAALFGALKRSVIETDNRKLVLVPHAINEPEFASRVVEAFTEIWPTDYEGRALT